MGTANAPEHTIFVFRGEGPTRLIGALFEAIDGYGNPKGRTKTRVGGNYFGNVAILAYREQRHAATMNTPSIHLHGLKFRGDASIENALVKIRRHTRAVIEEKEGANTLLLLRSDIDFIRTRITGVAQHLNDDIFDVLDIMLGLASLSLGDAKAYESISEVFLDA